MSTTNSAQAVPVGAAVPQTVPTSGIEPDNTSVNNESSGLEPEDEQTTLSRLKLLGISGLGLFGLMATLFCYLRLNHATRGFYSRRLQAGAALAAVVIVAIWYLLWLALA